MIDNIPNISVITQIEALSWITKDNNKEALVKEFIDYCNIYTITPNVVIKCVNIRKTKKIKTPDAITAATAIVNNMVLITSDTDFKNIQNLVLLNPSSM